MALPETEDEIQAEHDRQQDREAEESFASGHAEWEVRVSLPSHDATEALAAQLEAEGLPVVTRSTFLLVGAANRDDAEALAERLRAESPEGAKVEVEPGGGMVWEVMPQQPVRRVRRSRGLTAAAPSATLLLFGSARKGG